MDTEIKVALISTAGVVIAAVINNIRKKNAEGNTKIKQKAFGKNISQTGIQNNYLSHKDEDENV